MDWLPRHKCGLYLTHNENRDCYQTVSEWIDAIGIDDDEWVSSDEKEKSIADNELWSLHWYPDTPVGFCRILASSFDALRDYFAVGEGRDAL